MSRQRRWNSYIQRQFEFAPSWIICYKSCPAGCFLFFVSTSRECLSEFRSTLTPSHQTFPRYLPREWVSEWPFWVSFLSFGEPKGRCGDIIHRGNISLVARRVGCGVLRYCIFIALILSNLDFSGTSNFRNFLPRFIGWVGTPS